MKNLYLLIMIMFVFFIQGCANKISLIDEKNSLDVSQEVVVIFYMNINDFQETEISIREQTKDIMGGISESLGAKNRKISPKSEGYYILSFPPLDKNTVHALEAFYIKKNNVPDFVKGYGCNSTEHFAISIRKPGVYYLGDLYLESKNSKLTYTLESNLNKAKEYITRNKIKLSINEIVDKPLEIFEHQVTCGPGTIYIQI